MTHRKKYKKKDTDLVNSSSFCCHHLLSFLFRFHEQEYLWRSNKHMAHEGTLNNTEQKKRQIEGKKIISWFNFIAKIKMIIADDVS